MDPNQDLKAGIWVYFLLLIFEGALRKWFLPFLATPLLIVRDPIALWILITSARRGLFPLNGYVIVAWVTGVLGIATAMLAGHRNLPVAIYGARIVLIQFPMIFVIGKVLTREDVVEYGRVLIKVALVMTPLIALQFFSPQSAWVNRGVGGDLNGAGFSSNTEYFRPPGTFSFITGVAQFYGLLAPFVFYFWTRPELINRLLLSGGTACLLASIPFSISRTLLFSIFLTGLFTMAILIRRPDYLIQYLAGAGMIGVVAGLLALTPIMAPALEAFGIRLQSATFDTGEGFKGNIVDRILGGFFSGFENVTQHPFFGEGIGMGTNAGASLMSGDVGFLIAEDEWGRILGEQGVLIGSLLILVRLVLVMDLGVKSFRNVIKGDLLPWLIFSFAGIQILQGQWAQPASLGFAVFSAGLLMASLSRKKRLQP